MKSVFLTKFCTELTGEAGCTAPNTIFGCWAALTGTDCFAVSLPGLGVPAGSLRGEASVWVSLFDQHCSGVAPDPWSARTH
jgi:hypothetical protein